MSTKVNDWQPTPTFVVALAALVVAIAALVVAASGMATASPKVIVRRGDIAPGAVTGKALANGAVGAAKIKKNAITAPKLAKASVTSRAISEDAVTGSAIAPGSVGAIQFGNVEVVTKSIADNDKVAHNGEWTASNTENAACGSGGKLLGGGFAFANPNNGETTWLQAMPVANAEFQGFVGRFSSDAGGTASGEVVADCLEK
ncbi:MAG: hypothetical protein QM729_21145 [Solirubrobacterales bacterium]